MGMGLNIVVARVLNCYRLCEAIAGKASALKISRTKWKKKIQKIMANVGIEPKTFA